MYRYACAFVYKEDLALSNPQGLIYYKMQLNPTFFYRLFAARSARSCRIRQLHNWRGVSAPTTISVLSMTLNYLILMSFGNVEYPVIAITPSSL